METIGIFQAICYSLPFVLICLACYKINFSQAERPRQFWIPILAVIYSGICIFELEKYIPAVRDFIIDHESLFSFLAGSDLTRLNVMMIFVMNVIIAVVFLIIKVIALGLSHKFWASYDLVGSTSGIFYDLKKGVLPKSQSLYEMGAQIEKAVNDAANEDDWENVESENESGERREEHQTKIKKIEDLKWWVLKPGYRGYRLLFGGFYITCFLASLVLFIVSLQKPEWKLFQAAYYPVFAILMLGEFKAFLSGLDHIDEAPKIEAKKPEKKLTPNFQAFLNEIRTHYSDRALYDFIVTPEEEIPFSHQQIEDYIHDNDSANGQIVAAHFCHLYEEGHKLDINAVETTLRLMQGKSAIFYNPFYRDLTDYILLPIARSIYAFQKCLIIVGRDSAVDDVQVWCAEGIAEFFGTKELWRVGMLSAIPSEVEIGILKYSDIYNRDIQKANMSFLKEVGFVFLIEPSKMLSTGQMGLNLLVSQCEDEKKNLVYAACDRNCDGLVDALSHTLRTNIIDVSATLRSHALNSYIYWTAEGASLHHKIMPDISRYLGMGTEINILALKHQIRPAIWVSGDKFPVYDMKWIDGQYYGQLCKVANIPNAQAAFNDAFEVEPNLWKLRPVTSANYVLEDEFDNIFEISRLFATRNLKEGALNVISEHYLLRDYMYDNIKALMFDPKAIPTFVPDFARTQRNLVLKLIMLMDFGPLSEEKLKREFELIGIKPETGSRDNWDALGDFGKLLEKHCDISDGIRQSWKMDIQSNAVTRIASRSCYIQEESALANFAKKLKTAYFIAEDEAGNKHYMGARLYGHVFQAFLPGQFLTSEGKYYQVQSITTDNGVVLRRASDHIQSRYYYRQLRRIHISQWQEDELTASQQNVTIHCGDKSLSMKLLHGYARIRISTDGYMQMEDYADIAHAKRVLLNDIPDRTYKNKAIFKIQLPDATPAICTTIAILFNEIFKTVYPEGFHYVYAVTRFDNSVDANLSALLSILESVFQEDEIDDKSIVFIEDSDLDLGLLGSLERNLNRFFEWIADFLAWHIEMVSTPTTEEMEKLEGEMRKTERRIECALDQAAQNEDVEGNGRKGIWASFKDWVGRLFHKSQSEEKSESLDLDANEDEASQENDPAYEDRQGLEKQKERMRELRQIDWYKAHGFLFFGGRQCPEYVAVEETHDYLTALGYSESAYKAVREINCARNCSASGDAACSADEGTKVLSVTQNEAISEPENEWVMSDEDSQEEKRIDSVTPANEDDR